MRFNLHAGQKRAYESDARFVGVIAGTQSGKTEFGPIWLLKEVQRRGPGDYLVATPTFPLLNLKALPAFLKLFKGFLRLGEYVGGPTRKFTISKSGAKRLFNYSPEEDTVIYFGHAQDPESLESATALALWADEAGQNKFKKGSWDALQRRLAVNEGRALLTTTPYNLGWLKREFFDRWKRGDKTYDVVNFKSIMNPAFPRAEYERQRGLLPGWQFDLFYNGIFTRPAGVIYDCFSLEDHTCPRFAIPEHWKRYMGMDFGGVNTACVFFAQDPSSKIYYAYRTYTNKDYGGGTPTCKKHAANLLRTEPRIPKAIGGAKSENQWRKEMANGGLPIKEPDQPDVEIGITRVYGAIKSGQAVFFDDLDDLLEEMNTYSRPTGDDGQPMEGIEDKSAFHLLDAVRYILGYLFRDLLMWKSMGKQDLTLDQMPKMGMVRDPVARDAIRDACK